jgi:hypothetical protein
MAALNLEVPPVDLRADVVWLPVRHHSPGCAFHVDAVIRSVRPERVLIEGPRDATPLLPLLLDPELRAPVAVYSWYVDRRGEGLPRRHGAYYPLCDYSPELAGVRAAAAVGAETAFIDLTYPEMVLAESTTPPEGARSLQAEAWVRHSQVLSAAARRVGARDPDDLWDTLYESGFRGADSSRFFAGVLAYCALARAGTPPAQVEAEGHLAREAAMAAAVAAARVRTVVITGGFHTVALPGTRPRPARSAPLARGEDAGVTLMRYNFEQLDRLNGYASGMPSPAFYQHVFSGADPSRLVVRLARTLRDRAGAGSPADTALALEHVQRLASLRGHAEPTREDVLDGVRSLFVKGSLDVEGVAVMAEARRFLAGDRIGQVPARAGRPPLVLDFEASRVQHRLDHDGGEKETTLDLYRSAPHRASSRFLHRTVLLGVPFARLLRGPDFVHGTDVQRVQEVWRHEWHPSTEARLIEMAAYGATVEEAAVNLLLEQLAQADQAGQRSEVAAGLLVEACRCGLHGETARLLARTRRLVADDPSFASVVHTCEQLLLLSVSREPLEAHDLPGLEETADQAWTRAARLVGGLSATGSADEDVVLDALCAWRAAADTLGDTAFRQSLREERLGALAGTTGGNPAVAGAACGLLYGDGVLDGATLAARLAGQLASPRRPPTDGARFLRGILRAARSVCWQEEPVVAALDQGFRTMPEEDFVAQLPELRLAFSGLTPRESDAVGRVVSGRLGGAAVVGAAVGGLTEDDVMRAVRVDARVRARLQRDGLR